MKQALYSFFVLVMLGPEILKAQNNSPAKVSAWTRQFLWQMAQGKANERGALPSYVYQQDASGKLFVRAFVQQHAGFDQEILSRFGVIKATQAGDIFTAGIPVEQLDAFTRSPGIRAIDLDQAGAADLDSARRRTRVDSIHNSLGLPRAFRGDSIVVGIIDAGFDYTHPVFFDTLYQKYRVRRVWEQKGNGTPPANFPYGAEYSDSASILAKAYDVTETTHGTHVGGIAAGSGFAGAAVNGRKFRGVAYQSDLVLVGIYPSPAYWLNTGMADFLDGIRYTFDYAANQGKPAVANLSWGCPLGPRDGTSLFSQACDNITGPGRIFVVSGGNNGNNKIHLKKAFSPTDTVLHSFTTFSTALTEKINYIDVWGDSSQLFQMQFHLYSGNNRLTASEWIPLDGNTRLIKLKGTNGDTCYATVTGVASEFNGKPHMLIQYLNKVGDRVGFSVKATAGTVHLWQGVVVKTSGYYGNFTKYSYPWATDGDVTSTCGDLVSTRSALAVGAYNSKVNFTNVSGQNLGYTGYVRGRIAAFSSLGPTADGRTKPDITGPGLALASGFSSYDPSNASGGADYGSVVAEFISTLNGRTYAYGMAGGTSMSAPCVSGIVAMLLQVNPQLGPEGLKAILAATSIRDNNTGIIPPNGSSTWGFGKINAMGALKALLSPTGIVHGKATSPEVLVYPNPGTGSFRLEFSSQMDSDLELRITDALGREVRRERWSASEITWRTISLEGMAPGCYGLSVFSDSGVAQVRLMKR
jgi:hypothetical protein